MSVTTETANARHRRIAGWLCEVTRDVLWRPSRAWLERREPGVALRCRIGRGGATYHRRVGDAAHELTFGWKMVASKHCRHDAGQWKTAREITGRGYFGGDIALPGLLAHTCCHEFAHLVQAVNGWYRRGSIHNVGFYRILDRIHASGAAECVREQLLARARDHGVALAFDRDAPAAPAIFAPGDRVRFDYRGGAVLGEVMRVNRKTLTVRPLAPSSITGYFRVSPQLLALARYTGAGSSADAETDTLGNTP